MDYDRDELNKICLEHKIEVTEGENGLILKCARLPDEKVARQLADITKNIPFDLIESPKDSTIEALTTTLRGIGFQGSMGGQGRFICIYSTKEVVPADHPVWDELVEIIKRDGYFTTWDIVMGETKAYGGKNFDMKSTAITNSGKGKREHSPTPDEITDLKITLGPDRDVNDIINEL